MKIGLKRVQNADGDDIMIPFVSEKHDEFYIVSKQYLRKIAKVKSVKTIKYFNLLCEYLKFNDDRIQLSNEQKKEIRETKLKVDRQRIYKMNKELIELGLLMNDGKYLRIPANVVWHGDRHTKRNMIKSYVVQTMTPNTNF